MKVKFNFFAPAYMTCFTVSSVKFPFHPFTGDSNLKHLCSRNPMHSMVLLVRSTKIASFSRAVFFFKICIFQSDQVAIRNTRHF